MGNIIVLIKQVPDTWSEKSISEDDFTVDRTLADNVLDEINLRAIEAAVQLKEKNNFDNVFLLSMSPLNSKDSIRKGLAIGADKAYLIADEKISGSDVLQTAWVLTTAISTLPDPQLIIAGNYSTDGQTGAVPAIISEYLQMPFVPNVSKIEIKEKVTVNTELENQKYILEFNLPGIISVSEQIAEPRYPNFKSIMEAKKKEIELLNLASIEIQDDEVGAKFANSRVLKIKEKDQRKQGKIVEEINFSPDDLINFLADNKLI